MKDKRLSAAGTSKEAYDLVVVGAGPAGLTAATYAARYRLGALVIGQMVGGTAAFAHEICNFPGFNRIKGIELARKFSEQVTGLGVEIKAEKVVAIQKEGLFAVETAKDVYYAKKLILATGSERRKLNLNNEHQYVGKGVSYCATCDAPFYRDKVVGVVGGSDAALTAALLLSEFASSVHIIYRRGEFFRAKPAWVEQVLANRKIQPIFNCNVTGLIGAEALKGVTLDRRGELKLDGLFIEIGSTPNTELATPLGVRLRDGHIETDSRQKTDVRGVFSAGDVTTTPFKQIVVAAAQGAVAAYSAYSEIREEEGRQHA